MQIIKESSNPNSLPEGTGKEFATLSGTLLVREQTKEGNGIIVYERYSLENLDGSRLFVIPGATYSGFDIKYVNGIPTEVNALYQGYTTRNPYSGSIDMRGKAKSDSLVRFEPIKFKDGDKVISPLEKVIPPPKEIKPDQGETVPLVPGDGIY